MKEAMIVVVFHSERMLLTLDLNTLVQVLMEIYGRELTLRFRAMSDSEKEAAEEQTEILPAVRTRFLLKEPGPDGEEVRREDLERRIVREGRK